MMTPDGWPPNFTLRELTRSARADKLGIANAPTPEHEASLRALAWHILQPLRDHFGQVIPVTSGYRSLKLNAATPGASKTSQHALGQAVDIDMKASPKATISNAALFYHLRANLPFDQMIWEYGTAKEPQWVHVSFVAVKPRGQILRCTGTPAAPKYAPWVG